MPVLRTNAVINNPIQLDMVFMDGNGGLINPASISKVQIQDAVGNVLQEIDPPNITQIDSGTYEIVTSATWNTVARTVYDVWFYVPTVGALSTTTKGTTVISDLTAIVEPTSYIDVQSLKISNVGLDFSGYSTDELQAVVEIAKSVVDTYCGRKFGPGVFTEKGQTVCDREGKVFIRLKNKPVAQVNSLTVYYSGSALIPLPLQYIDLFEDYGYLYFSTSHSPYNSVQGASYPSVVLSLAEKLFYIIEYVVAAPIPVMVKQASAMIAANLLKSNYIMRDTGVPNQDVGVSKFTSGFYDVEFTQLAGADAAIFTPAVKQMLSRYRMQGSNVY